VLVAIATAFGLSSTLQAWALESLAHEPLPPRVIAQLLTLYLAYWYVPALLAPFIMRAVMRERVSQARWSVQIGAHTAGALAYSIVHTAAMLALRAILLPAGGPTCRSPGGPMPCAITCTLGDRRATTLGRQMLALLPEMRRPSAFGDRLVVKANGRIYFVPTRDIDWCEAAGNYVRLHVGQKTHLVRETMHDLETRLDPAQFMRIHRWTMVNVERIQELRSSFNGEYIVQLHGGARLTLSRGYRDALQVRLGKSF